MITLNVAAAGFVVTVLMFLMKSAADIRKEAIDATKDRANISAQLEVITYRLTRIEKELEEFASQI